MKRIVLTIAIAGMALMSWASKDFEGKKASGAALDGNCAVCVVEKEKIVPGKAEFKSMYKGKAYLFPGAKQKAMFDKNPAKYTHKIDSRYTNAKKNIALNGDCAVCAFKGKVNPGKAEFSSVYGGKTYLFPNANIKKMFDKEPAKYTTNIVSTYNTVLAKKHALGKAEGSHKKKSEGSHKKKEGSHKKQEGSHKKEGSHGR